MKITIANKKNINEVIATQNSPFGIVAISNPYPDPTKYDIPVNNIFKGMLKLEFYDCEQRAMSDERLRYNSGHHRALLSFIEAMLSIGVAVIICHCDRGLHRSVAAAEIIRRVYTAKGIDVKIVNPPEPYEPNHYMLTFINGKSSSS